MLVTRSETGTRPSAGASKNGGKDRGEEVRRTRQFDDVRDFVTPSSFLLTSLRRPRLRGSRRISCRRADKLLCANRHWALTQTRSVVSTADWRTDTRDAGARGQAGSSGRLTLSTSVNPVDR